MLEDDDQPIRTKPDPARLLEKMSVAELEARIVQLKAEIAKSEAELAKRKDVRSAAEALFKRPA